LSFENNTSTDTIELKDRCRNTSKHNGECHLCL